jgi:hypothetical protein
MKEILLFLNLFFVSCVYSQNNKTIQILNKKDSTAIESANIFIENKFITNSDNQGYFSINTLKDFKTIKISHVIFGDAFFTKDKIINTDKIYIEERTNNLEEVMISFHKKIKKLIFPEKDILSLKNYGVSFPFNSEVAIYVPNNDLLENYIIKQIIIKTEKNQFIKNNNSKFVPFEVNLYSVDSVKGIPGEKIFKDNFFAIRNKNEENVTVDLGDISRTLFPKNGIFIVIGLFDEEYYNKIGYFEKPSFKVVRKKKKSNFKEYHRMLIDGEKGDWIEPMYSKINLQCFYFGLEIIK